MWEAECMVLVFHPKINELINRKPVEMHKIASSVAQIGVEAKDLEEIKPYRSRSFSSNRTKFFTNLIVNF